MSWKYLPDNKENKLYSPRNIMELIIKAKDKAGGDDAFYNNHKNKKLIEMEYASAFAIAMYSRRTRDKYYIYPAENPDIHFIKQDSVNKRKIGFSVEIMTLFDYNSCPFNQHYEQLADLIWQKKGKVDYDRTELLLIPRLNCWFNIDKFVDAMEKYDWKFLQIWLGTCNGVKDKWDFLGIISPQCKKYIKITSNLNDIF